MSWTIEPYTIREGRRVMRRYQVVDLSEPLPGSNGLMHASLGSFNSEKEARAAIRETETT